MSFAIPEMTSKGGQVIELKGEFKCNTCGGTIPAKLPMSFDEFRGKMNKLFNDHKKCLHDELKEIDQKVSDVCDG